MTFGDCKDLNKRTFADQVWCDKAFNIAKDPKYDGINMVLLQCFIIFLVKKISVVV